MNLRLSLVLRIAATAVLCLVVAAAWVLLQADRASRSNAEHVADLVARQVELQFLGMSTSVKSERFPDWDVLADTGGLAGVCVRYVSADGRSEKSSCQGSSSSDHTTEAWFDRAYRTLFDPGAPVARELRFRNHPAGSIIVTSDAAVEVARAWRDLCALFGLTAIALLAQCVLVYVSVGRALRPTQALIAGLQRMEAGDLAYRLPHFALDELRRIGEACNRLAANLQDTLTQRAELSRKLMHLQEDERRYLARELHDEFGQCLAAVNAHAASVVQTAEAECPGLLPDGQSIARIADHMMGLLRGMLLRLRHSGIDELGLVNSVQGLVRDWQARLGANTHFTFETSGDLDSLPAAINVDVYRIVQECLNNVAKHSGANAVQIRLARPAVQPSVAEQDNVGIRIEDNGLADESIHCASGLGLLGIKERVSALGGQLSLQLREGGGLVVLAQIPLSSCGSPAS